MLVLTRKAKEEIRIGNNITITILKVRGQAVRVGIDAPGDVRIVRGELTNHDPGEGDEGSAELLGHQQDANTQDATEQLPSGRGCQEHDRLPGNELRCQRVGDEPCRPSAVARLGRTAPLGEQVLRRKAEMRK